MRALLRSPCGLAAFALSLAGCNLIFGIEEGTLGSSDGGGGTGANGAGPAAGGDGAGANGAGPAGGAASGGAPSGGNGEGGQGGGIIGSPCNAIAQDCPGGLKCLPQEPGSGICAENGTAGNDQGCSAVHPNAAFDDCAAGLLCQENRCRPVCDPNIDDCDPLNACFDFGASFAVCVPFCDPLSQNCGGGQGCYWTPDDDFICAPDPFKAPVGSECMFVNGCDAGLYCGNCGGNGCCRSFCNVASPGAACLAVENCVPLEFPVPFQNVGVCAPP